jgi:taurine dioxygenase
MSLRITPLSPALGARIDGVDIASPLDDATIAAIRAAWLAHLVLLFPGAPLTLEQQREFAGRFGKLAERASPPEERAEGADFARSFLLVSNIRGENGKPIGTLPDGEMWFHHDMSYVKAPHAGTFLHAIEVPHTGGNTLFANMYRAYDSIPPALKATLAGRRVLHIFNYTQAERCDPDGDLTGIHHVWQPLFVRHPESGRIALYANRLMAARIEGLDRADSDAILEELFAIVEDRANVFEHAWTPGDTLLWDNRCSTHARTDFPADQRRLLRRCTIEGAPMVAAEAETA